jgi:hypothetical protein
LQGRDVERNEAMRDTIDMAETISHGWWLDDEKLKAFEALVRADEREACAKVCDRMAARCNDIRAAALDSAADNIRARGNT